MAGKCAICCVKYSKNEAGLPIRKEDLKTPCFTVQYLIDELQMCLVILYVHHCWTLDQELQ